MTIASDHGTTAEIAANAATYQKLNGEVVDLAGLTGEERDYLAQVYHAYLTGTAWRDVCTWNETTENPLLRPTGGRITRTVWDHPLWQAVRDLEDRIGIRQEMVGPEPGDLLDLDPLTDGWISTTEAADRKGVSVAGLHQAIARGEIIARPVKSGGVRRVVSVNSLDRWTPNPVRQRAGRLKRVAS